MQNLKIPNCLNFNKCINSNLKNVIFNLVIHFDPN